MQKLEAALTRFIEQQDLYNRDFGLFSDHEIRKRSEVRLPPVDDRITLSPELAYLYSHYEMMDAKAEGTHKMKNAAIEIGESAVIYFVSPEHLVRQQMGYRWISDKGETVESSNWPSHHVVVANVNDDPLIVDVQASGSPVYAAFEGGEPKLITNSLADCFHALSILIEGALLFQGETSDEETYETKPDFLAHVMPSLSDLLGSEHMNALLEYLSLR
ncbi:hypothetical protein SAMN04488688_11627 [Paenibacillus sp. cl141a]|uniref:hypothetical protein n=1 Tax=Paenibacillus sp. cl141a TaxID=1761877 RepID=UPI0008B94285|nr:hypothetical protein [Paenibacillus sp. cl141a]SEM61868.1 hypothetical protein SAMN04488688_11627 [Paenibacillus sp. cl141a]